MNNPKIGTSSYESGFQKDDKILQIGAISLDGNVSINSVLNSFKVGEVVPIIFERYGARKEAKLTIKTDTSYDLSLVDDNSKGYTKAMQQKRASWLGTKQ